jgi:hypothetical protein
VLVQLAYACSSGAKARAQVQAREKIKLKKAEDNRVKDEKGETCQQAFSSRR